MLQRHRLAIAGVVTAAAVAVPAVAFASGSGSSPGKPASPHGCAASACKSKVGSPGGPGRPADKMPTSPSQLAASAGISMDRLVAGLGAAKRAGGDTAAGAAAFAAAAGVPQKTAERIVHAMFGAQAVGGKTGGPSVAPALASELGVSISAAQRALNQLDALGRDGTGPASPAFAAIARDLGVSPARLAAALAAVKQSEAAKAPVNGAGKEAGNGAVKAAGQAAGNGAGK
jgi:hypothetical protein